MNTTSRWRIILTWMFYDYNNTGTTRHTRTIVGKIFRAKFGIVTNGLCAAI